ncbi:MAG: hypothetical protein ND807_12355 [Vicinamibacterales bacterium]|nr:hypothetical protein [Vicinamibacterales bacterium]
MRRLPPIAVSLVVMLLLGFARSGLATGRLYLELFSAPAASGPAATIEGYLSPLNLGSADELRHAVKRARWRDDADISMIVDPASFLAGERSQLHMATSYALYPARVFLRSEDDVRAIHSAGRAQQLIVAGPTNPFPGAGVEDVSSRLRLVSLP